MVKVALAAPHTDDDCPFCKTEESVYMKNFLAADYDEAASAGNSSDNHSGTLAKNLSGFTTYTRPITPDESKKTKPRAEELDVNKPVEKGEKAPFDTMSFARAEARTWHKEVFEAGTIPVLYGAHHLIPGNDSLGASILYENKKLGPVDDGDDKDNIGYNVNSANNGAWLVSNYAVKGWGGMDEEFKKSYAFLAMYDSGRQFHDSHRKPYSTTVKKVLDDLDKLMGKMKDGCPFCGEGESPSAPVYHLNARLNAISRWLLRHLTSDVKKWEKDIVTSSWCTEYKKFLANDPKTVNRMRNEHPAE